MYRLIVDIIRSLRIQGYNYYELPRVRQHENAQIYQAVMTRYVPPTQEEVAVVEEMRRMSMAQGRNIHSVPPTTTTTHWARFLS